MTFLAWWAAVGVLSLGFVGLMVWADAQQDRREHIEDHLAVWAEEEEEW